MAPFNPGAFQNCAFFTGAQEIGAFWPPDPFEKLSFFCTCYKVVQQKEI